MSLQLFSSVLYILLLTSSVEGAAFVPSSTSFATRTNERSTAPTALSASSGGMACRPIGIGSAAPKTVISNVDLEAVVETSDDWIQSRTGIAKRRVLLQDESIRDLAIRASKQALSMAKVDATDIDVVICATSSPDDIFGDAPSIASELGCSTETMAFDLTAACSGFLFGTVTASKFLSGAESGTKRALVIGADALSRWIDWDDRNSCILFGDGAGAMVLEASDESGVLAYAAHSNGGGYDSLTCGYGGTPRNVATPGEGTTLSNGAYDKLAMKGRDVYKFATREVPTVLEEALDASGITVDDVDWLLLHQANIRIMEVVADRLGVPMEKVITNLSEYGNTSAASIPLALDEAVRSGQVKKGDVIACAGFGAGLSWGAAILKWG